MLMSSLELGFITESEWRKERKSSRQNNKEDVRVREREVREVREVSERVRETSLSQLREKMRNPLILDQVGDSGGLKNVLDT